MLNTFTQCQNLAEPNGFGDICEQLLSDPYVLFLITAAIFRQINNPHISSMQDTPRKTTTTMTDVDGRKVMAIAHMAFGQVSLKVLD